MRTQTRRGPEQMNGVRSNAVHREIEAADPRRRGFFDKQLATLGKRFEALFQNAGLPGIVKRNVDVVSHKASRSPRSRLFHLRPNRNFRVVTGGLLSGADDLRGERAYFGVAG